MTCQNPHMLRMRKRHPRLLLTGIVYLYLACVTMVGCATETVYDYSGPPPGQRYDLSEVNRRAEQLKVGMSRAAVYMLLGSPAKREGGDWIYLPSRSGTLLPSASLKVHFERGRFASMQMQPIVLGERFK